MFSQPLSTTLHLFRLAERQATLSGYVRLNQLPRFAKLVIIDDDQANVMVNLSCYWDQDRRCLVDVTIKGSVQLACQRCLDAMECVVDSSVTWWCQKKAPIPASRRAARNAQIAPDSLDNTINRHQKAVVSGVVSPELVEVESLPVDITGWIEDELMISLPLVARHDFSCQVHASFSPPSVSQSSSASQPYGSQYQREGELFKEGKKVRSVDNKQDKSHPFAQLQQLKDQF